MNLIICCLKRLKIKENAKNKMPLDVASSADQTICWTLRQQWESTSDHTHTHTRTDMNQTQGRAPI